MSDCIEQLLSGTQDTPDNMKTKADGLAPSLFILRLAVLLLSWSSPWSYSAVLRSICCHFGLPCGPTLPFCARFAAVLVLPLVLFCCFAHDLLPFWSSPWSCSAVLHANCCGAAQAEGLPTFTNTMTALGFTTFWLVLATLRLPIILLFPNSCN